MSERAGKSFDTPASAKQKPDHRLAMTARKISDKNADMDYHAVRPPEYQAGGDSMRENLSQQDSERVYQTTPGASSSGQLAAAGASSSGRPVATEDLSSAKKFHLPSNTDGDSSRSGSSMIPQRISGRRARRRTSYQSLRFPAQRFDLEPVYERLLVGFILAHKVSRRLQKDGDE